MSTYTGKTLAAGQVAASATAIYTCPSATQAFIQKVLFFNNSATEQTLVVSITRSGGSARNIRQFVLDINESAELSGINLSAGDTLNAVTTTATEVDYTVTGVEAA